MTYSVLIKPQAKKSLFTLPDKEIKRIIKIIDSLQINPRPVRCLKLESYESVYRIRSGNYQIIYSIDDNNLIIEVIKVGHRKNIYNKM